MENVTWRINNYSIHQRSMTGRGPSNYVRYGSSARRRATHRLPPSSLPIVSVWRPGNDKPRLTDAILSAMLWPCSGLLSKAVPQTALCHTRPSSPTALTLEAV